MTYTRNQMVQPLQISLFNQQTQVIFKLLIMMPQITKVSLSQMEG